MTNTNKSESKDMKTIWIDKKDSQSWKEVSEQRVVLSQTRILDYNEVD